MKLIHCALFFFIVFQDFMLPVQQNSGNIPLTKKEREKVEVLLNRMTLEEKVHQLASFYQNANKRLNIPHMQAGEAQLFN